MSLDDIIVSGNGIDVWMVRGPASVITEGRCHVIGKDVSSSEIAVRADKILPFEPEKNCTLRIKVMDQSAGGWYVDPSAAGMSLWRKIVSDIVKNDKINTIMIIGDTDSGKSTLSTFIANMAIDAGRLPYIVDGDIGQGDLAPPAALGAVYLNEQAADLYDVDPDFFDFIGNTTPAGVEFLVIKKIKSLVARAGNSLKEKRMLTIINTDGYLSQDTGVEYKIQMAKEIEPDLILCLENDDIVSSVFKRRLTTAQILSLNPIMQMEKTKKQRVDSRIKRFEKFSTGWRITKRLMEIVFSYQDKKTPGRRLKYKGFLRLPGNRIIFREEMRGMFVALGMSGKVIGFGIITSAMLSKISVQTPVKNFDTIYLGNIKLSRDRKAELRIRTTIQT